MYIICKVALVHSNKPYILMVTIKRLVQPCPLVLDSVGCSNSLFPSVTLGASRHLAIDLCKGCKDAAQLIIKSWADNSSWMQVYRKSVRMLVCQLGTDAIHVAACPVFPFS